VSPSEYTLPSTSLALTPDQATFLRQFLLPQIRSEHSVTRTVILAIPAEHQDYRPNPKSRSALELARHIALCEIWFLDAILDGHFTDITAPAGRLGTSADVAEWFAENGESRLTRITALSGDALAKPVDWLGLRNDPAVTYLNIAIRHSVHHRGQLSAYLRPMGGIVPAIYVESGDVPYPPADGSEPIHPPPSF
jgi:uncharacterized damage-inducible protein DinB